jgi:Xaa-Pro aminopeptidase
MFPTKIYQARRHSLKKIMSGGLVLFLGNQKSPMSYPDTVYPFVQDANFLYFWGLDTPGLAAFIDLDSGDEVVLGKNPTVEQMIWDGPRPGLSDLQNACGTDQVMDLDMLAELVDQAIHQGRKVHFLPQYRGENKIWLHELTGINLSQTTEQASEELIKAIVSLREIKIADEVAEIELAVDLTSQMIQKNMRDIKPGYTEKEAAARAICVAQMHTATSFPIILTTQGYYYHISSQKNVMQAGDVVIQDCGAESKLHYAADITRTIPVSGRFSEQQREIYNIVFTAQEAAIDAMAPGVEFRKLHNLSALTVVKGLQDLGIMQGDAKEAVAEGAHALFWSGGLGHMMGLGVHDMEELGEDYVGYNDEIRRSSQFGTNRLRMAKPLKPGMVMTVEPGLYFNPGLIELWSTERRFSQFINYNMVDKYKDLGGYRIEDDVLVTKDGYRVLGQSIPKSIAQVEEITSQT